MKDIRGFEGLYKVTEKGEIISFKSGRGCYKTPTKLKPGYNSKGYLQVRIYNSEKKGFTLRIHRIVAETFIPNPFNLPQVNHRDGNKDNNDVSNLEWCNNQQNCEHSRSKRYRLIKQNGESVEVFNLNKFCKENGYHGGDFSRLKNGGRPSAYGFIKIEEI